MPTRFIQIHALTSYPGVLLNRDDAGFAKRLPFGGAVRTRVSSQCLKRHWRTFEGRGSLNELELPPSIRSRETFEREIVLPLVGEGLDEARTRASAEAVLTQVLDLKKARKSEDTLATGQITVLGRPEIDLLMDLVRAAATNDQDPAKTILEALKGESGKNLKAMKLAAGLDAALFGRMVTSSYLARGDSAVQVAHAFTVHAQEDETDYFSAVDELKRDDADADAGSGHIGSSELTSGLYYLYVVVDVPQLVSNLEGCDAREWDQVDRGVASAVVSRLVRLIATVSPGAKKGSTAPFAYAQGVLVEAGDYQPRTLANAFQKPTSTRPDVLANAVRALEDHVADYDRVYGATWQRAAIGVGSANALGQNLGSGDVASLDELCDWAADRIAS